MSGDSSTSAADAPAASSSGAAATPSPAATAADASTSGASGAADSLKTSIDSADKSPAAPTAELTQQPKESLRPGGALRPQRFGANKDKGGAGSGSAGGGAGGSGNRPGSSGGGASRRPFASAAAAKGPAEPKPKPQLAHTAAAAPAAAEDTEDTAAANTTAEKAPEKVPKTEADAKTADGQHRLQSQWTFWFDKPQGHTARRVKGATAATEVYESSLREVGSFETVEGFWRHFNFMRKPSDLEVGANYHLFKTGIKPMWEDRANAHGGKWQVRVKDRHQLDEFWQNLVLALVGETADEGDEICGVVMSRRRGGDRLAVWTRRKDESVRPLGILLKQFMLDDSAGTKKTSVGVMLEYSFHESSMKSGSSYGSDVVFTV